MATGDEPDKEDQTAPTPEEGSGESNAPDSQAQSTTPSTPQPSLGDAATPPAVDNSGLVGGKPEALKEPPSPYLYPDDPQFAQAQAKENERYTIAQAKYEEAQAREQQRQQFNTAKLAGNQAAAADFKTTGRQYQQNEEGIALPKIDPVTVRQAVTDRTGPVQYDDQGKPYQASYTANDAPAGSNVNPLEKTIENPDAGAAYGRNPDDPQDPNIYKKNKNSPWEAIPLKQAYNSPDPALSNTAANIGYSQAVAQIHVKNGFLHQQISQLQDSLKPDLPAVDDSDYSSSAIQGTDPTTGIPTTISTNGLTPAARTKFANMAKGYAPETAAPEPQKDQFKNNFGGVNNEAYQAAYAKWKQGDDVRQKMFDGYSAILDADNKINGPYTGDSSTGLKEQINKNHGDLLTLQAGGPTGFLKSQQTANANETADKIPSLAVLDGTNKLPSPIQQTAQEARDLNSQLSDGSTALNARVAALQAARAKGGTAQDIAGWDKEQASIQDAATQLQQLQQQRDLKVKQVQNAASAMSGMASKAEYQRRIQLQSDPSTAPFASKLDALDQETQTRQRALDSNQLLTPEQKQASQEILDSDIQSKHQDITQGIQGAIQQNNAKDNALTQQARQRMALEGGTPDASLPDPGNMPPMATAQYQLAGLGDASPEVQKRQGQLANDDQLLSTFQKQGTLYGTNPTNTGYVKLHDGNVVTNPASILPDGLRPAGLPSYQDVLNKAVEAKDISQDQAQAMTQRLSRQAELAQGPIIDQTIGNDAFKGWLAQNDNALWQKVKDPTTNKAPDLQPQNPADEKALREAALKFIATSPSFLDKAADSAMRFSNAALLDTFGSAATAAGAIDNAVSGKDTDIGSWLKGIGEGSDELQKQLQDPRMNGTWQANVAQGAGGLAGFILPGAVIGDIARGAGASNALSQILAHTATAATGAVQNIAMVDKQLPNFGVDEKKALAPLLWSGLVGAAVVLPVGHAMESLAPTARGIFANAVRESAINAANFAALNTGQTMANNEIAKIFYDKNRDIFDGVGEGIKSGGITGAVMGLLTGTVAGVRGRMAQLSPADQIRVKYGIGKDSPTKPEDLFQADQQIGQIGGTPHYSDLSKQKDDLTQQLSTEQDPDQKAVIQSQLSGVNSALKSDPKNIPTESRQDLASAILKVAHGVDVSDLSENEHQSLQAARTSNGVPFLDDHKGNPILADAAKDWLSRVAPKAGEIFDGTGTVTGDAARQQIDQSEAIKSAANENTPPSQQQGETPNPEGEGSGSSEEDRSQAGDQIPGAPLGTGTREPLVPEKGSRAWKLSKSLQAQGVEQAVADHYAAGKDSSYPPDAKIEDLRDQITSDFKSDGGVIPAHLQSENEDSGYWKANFPEEPDANHSQYATIAKANNAKRVSDAHRANQHLLDIYPSSPDAEETKTAESETESPKPETIKGEDDIPDGRPLSSDEKKTAKQYQSILIRSGAEKDAAAAFSRQHVRDGGTAENLVEAFNKAGGIENPKDLSSRIKASETATEPHFKELYGKFQKAYEQQLGRKLDPKNPGDAKKIEGAKKALGLMVNSIKKWNSAFENVRISAKGTPDKNVAGVAAHGHDLVINIEDILNEQLGNLDALAGNAKRADATVSEEAIHVIGRPILAEQRTARGLDSRDSIISSLDPARAEKVGETPTESDLADAEAADIFNSLPDELKSHVGNVYSDTPGNHPAWELGHEFLRMLAQHDIEVDRGGKLSENGSFLSEQTLPQSIVKKLREYLQGLMSYFGKLSEKLKAEGTDAGMISNIENVRGKIREAIKAISSEAKEKSADQYGKELARQQAEAKTTQESASQPSNPDTEAKNSELQAKIDKMEADAKSAEDQKKAEADRIAERKGKAVLAKAANTADKEKIMAQVPEDAKAAAEDALNHIQMGEPTYVLGTNREKIPVVMAAIPSESIETSHKGMTFEVNPNYGGKNTREYHNNPEEQQKVLGQIAPGKLDPDSYVTDAKSASLGSPQVALVTFTDAQGNLQTRIQTAGGNGRQMIHNLSSPEDQERHLEAWQDASERFGLKGMPEGWQGARFLGYYDLRDPAKASEYQQLVDKLNPNEGMIADVGARAEIDASHNIPIERLIDMPVDMSPEAAQGEIVKLLRDSDKLGIDRNLMAGYARNPKTAQDYIQRLILAAGFRSKALNEFYAKNSGSGKNATVTGLIRSATPMALQLREKGMGNLVDAIGRTLERVAEYTNQGKNIRLAIKTAADQMEMGDDSPTINLLADALQNKVETYLNKAGDTKIQSDETISNFQDLLGDISTALKAHDPEPDIFGETQSPLDTLRQAISAHFKKVDADGGEEGAAPALSARGSREQDPAKRMLQLLKKQREEGLNRYENDELTGLEKKNGQNFMEFFDQTKKDEFALEQEAEAQGLPKPDREQMDLFARGAMAGSAKSTPTKKEIPDGNFPKVDDSQPDRRLTAIHKLSESNLAYADQMGGLAVPSVAVTKPGNYVHGFGDISLVGGRSIGSAKENPVHSSDAYSSRHPRPEYKKVKSSIAQKTVDDFRPFAEKFSTRNGNDATHYIWQNSINKPDPDTVISNLLRDNGAKAAYLSSVHGENPEPIMRPANDRFGLVGTPAFQKYLQENPGSLHRLNYDDIEGRKKLADTVLNAYEESERGQRETGMKDILLKSFKEGMFGNDGLVPFGLQTALERDVENYGKTIVDSGASQEMLDGLLKGRENDFQNWLTKKIGGMYEAPRIKVNGKWEPYTLENVTRVMTAGKIAGSEKTMTYGSGMARAVSSTRFSSDNHMKNEAEGPWGIASEAEHHAAMEAAEAKMSFFRESAVPHYKWNNTWDALDSSSKAIARYLKSGSRTKDAMRRALSAEDFTNVPDSVIERGMEAAKELSESPVPYFESKPQRIVRLNEFHGAVISDDAKPETRAILEKNGIQIETVPKDKINDADAVGAALKKIHDANPDTLFARGSRDDKDFYSQLQRTIEAKMPNRSSVDQLKAIIDPAKGSGVKPDEIKWSNLDDFLDGKTSVTKPEVLDYLKNEGSVKFEEKIAGADPDPDMESEINDLQNQIDRQQQEYDEAVDEGNNRDWQDDESAMQSHSEYLKSLKEDLDASRDQLRQLNIGEQPAGGKYSQYVIPGGENYREVVLTMPGSDHLDLKGGMEARQMEDGSWNIWDKKDWIYKKGASSKQEILGRAANDEMLAAKNQDVYRSSHFSDIPNYVAHMRLDDRPDEDGKPGTLIEEIQSDRHQQGREKGYSNQKRDAEIEAERNRLEDEKENAFKARQRNLTPETEAAFRSAADALIAFKNLDKPHRGIPDAPFRKDWHIQMFKRALRDAVSNGKEWIGWTDGQTQADRYDLSKKISRIDLQPNAHNGNDYLAAYDMDGRRVIDKIIKPEELPDYIGKEAAQKLHDQEPKQRKVENPNGSEVIHSMKSLSGLDLKVGGEGMKGFYDQILPKEIGKYVKKWGGKVEEGSVPSKASETNSGVYDVIHPDNSYSGKWDVVKRTEGRETASFDSKKDAQAKADELNGIKGPTPIWKVEITPEMKAGVEAGQPLFARGAYEDPNQPELDFTQAKADGEKSPAQRLREAQDIISSEAAKFQGMHGYDKDEAEQRARLAVAAAAKSFDPENGAAFKTYATKAIRNAMLKMYKQEATHAEQFPTTLDAEVPGESENVGTVKDQTPDESSPQAPEETAKNEAAATLKSAISELPEKMQNALHGFMDGKTLEQIGQESGISKQGAAKILDVAMSRLRGKLGERGIKEVSDLYARGARESTPEEDISDLLKSITDEPLPSQEKINDLRDKALTEEDGKKTIGRPDLAYGAGMGAEGRAVDQAYTDEQSPRTFAQWLKDGQAIIDKDEAGFTQKVIRNGLAGIPLSDGAETMAARIVAEKLRAAAAGGNPEAWQKFTTFWTAYRGTGTAASDVMNARRDLFMTPGERNRSYLIDQMTRPSKAAKDAMAAETDPGKRQEILSKETAAILAKLKAAGITPEHILKNQVELSVISKKLLSDIRDTLFARGANEKKAASQLAFDLILKNRSLDYIAKSTGMKASEVQEIKNKMIGAIRAKMFDAFKAGTLDENGKGKLGGKARSAEEAEGVFQKYIRNLGIVSDKEQGKPTFSIEDPAHAKRMYQAIREARGESSIGDKVYEAWVEGLLSGPQTHIAIASSNFASVAWDATMQRGMEALINSTLIHDPKSAQFGEFKYLFNGILPSVQKAYAIAAKGWAAEHDFYKSTVLGTPDEMNRDPEFSRGGGHIPGQAGKIIRVPGRAVLFADHMFTTTYGHMQVGAQAYRIAKAEGLKGDAIRRRVEQLSKTKNDIIQEYSSKNPPSEELVKHIAEGMSRIREGVTADDLIKDHGSEAWQMAREQSAYDAAKKDGWTSEAWERAYDHSQKVTFKNNLQSKKEGGNEIEDIASKIQDARKDSMLTSVFFPFVRTPYNIFRQGIRKSPLGAGNLAVQVGKGLWGMKDGKPYINGHPEVVRDLAEQAIAWGGMALIAGAVQGDKNDDDKQLLITGSPEQEEFKNSNGMRELNDRTTGGGYVVRIGGRNGVYLPYGRVEPFVTVMGATADIIRAAKRNGTLASDLPALWNFMLGEMNSKSFLQGINNISELIKGRNDPLQTIKKTVLTALVPNIIRSPLRAWDDYVRDSKTAPAAYTSLPSGSLAEPKIGVYGDPVQKSGNPLVRTLVSTPLAVSPEAQPADTMFNNWNRENPEQAYAPDEPKAIYKGADGKERPMPPAIATRFKILAGKLVTQNLKGIVNARSIENPHETDIQAAKTAVAQAHSQAREMLLPALRSAEREQ